MSVGAVGGGAGLGTQSALIMSYPICLDVARSTRIAGLRSYRLAVRKSARVSGTTTGSVIART